jgi:hypothetical protein
MSDAVQLINAGTDGAAGARHASLYQSQRICDDGRKINGIIDRLHSMSQFVKTAILTRRLCIYNFRDSDADEHLGFVLPKRRAALGFVLPSSTARRHARVRSAKARDRARSVGMVELGSFCQNGMPRLGSFCQNKRTKLNRMWACLGSFCQTEPHVGALGFVLPN